ncbi:hypothetical protein D3C86_1387640 [compost metagenome]
MSESETFCRTIQCNGNRNGRTVHLRIIECFEEFGRNQIGWNQFSVKEIHIAGRDNVVGFHGVFLCPVFIANSCNLVIFKIKSGYLRTQTDLAPVRNHLLFQPGRNYLASTDGWILVIGIVCPGNGKDARQQIAFGTE